MKIVCIQKVFAVLHHFLTSLATQYLALTVNGDPYSSRHFAKPASVIDSIKVLVSFFQVFADCMDWTGKCSTLCMAGAGGWIVGKC